ncbi:MAG: glycosyl hydrolase family 95 catalytic domain-containing protein [Anaerolineae bacterium]
MQDESLFDNLCVWYFRPAERWSEALPLANGRLGAMLYGGPRAERLALSEVTFWSGEPSAENVPPGAADLLPGVRRLLLAGDYAGATALAQGMVGRKLNYGTNLPFGNLRLFYDHMELEAGDYRRELDLDTGVARVSYRLGGYAYNREVFISAPHQVLALRLATDRPAGLNIRIALDGDEQPWRCTAEGADILAMEVLARETQHSDGLSGVNGRALLRVLSRGGLTRAVMGSQLALRGGQEALILLAAATDFGGADPQALCAERIEAAGQLTWEELAAAHVAEHRRWFRRCGLDLGPAPTPALPLDERLAAVRAGADDPQLCALFFQFGRYLLLGSSRPDSPLPAARQGAWNDNTACRIGWTDDYHLDINTQMNYWVAETTGLGACCLPLCRWVAETLVPSGRLTARALYGAQGWAAHTVSNAWGYSAWGWDTRWGVFPTGGIWAALHLWDHYRFNPDTRFLAGTAYPVLRGAAKFVSSYLFDDGRGHLLSGPSNSPENSFLVDGGNYTLSLSPTVDNVLVRELLNACLDASETLGVDADLRAQWQAILAQLPPYRVGRHGQLQEWLEDYAEAVPGHRHTSHLLGLYPYAQITPRGTPELAQAARVSFERRMQAAHYEEGAWARNNTTGFYARLHDGPAAYASLLTTLRVEADTALTAGTRLAPANAYEMDYNTGVGAAMAEMLLQSQAGELELLPALPPAWPRGRVTGLCARGGYTLDITWEGGKLREAVIRASRDGFCRLRAGAAVRVTLDETEVPLHSEAGVLEFTVQAGWSYRVAQFE